MYEFNSWPPQPRGPLSQWAIRRIFIGSDSPVPPVPVGDGFSDDLQLALYLTYEIHYSDHKFLVENEWDPRLIEFRTKLEYEFERELVRATQALETAETFDVTQPLEAPAPSPGPVGTGAIGSEESVTSPGVAGSLGPNHATPSLDDLPVADNGTYPPLNPAHSPYGAAVQETPVSQRIYDVMHSDTTAPLSLFMEHHGTLEDFQRYLKHRSLYQLKEADPHTLGIPHATGLAKQWLMKIQAGEYGVDEEDRVMHSTLFAKTMADCGLKSAQNVYINEVTSCAFILSNVLSLFAFNRRLTPALFGHLAGVETTSVEPMTGYFHAAQRLGLSKTAQQFFKVHTLADVEHEQWGFQMVDQLATQDPSVSDLIVFGAQALRVAEETFTRQLHPRYDSVITA